MKSSFLKDYKKHFFFIILLLVFFFLTRFLSLERFQDQEANKIILNQIKICSFYIKHSIITHPILIPFLFSIIYFLITILYIPFIGAFFVLIAGSMFGLCKGIIFYSFLSSISYTISFLISRHFFYKNIQNKIGEKGRILIKSFERDGTMYLLSIRLSGMLPAVIINTAMGLTRVKTLNFYLTAQVGTLPNVIIMVYAGTQIENIKDINHIIPNSVLLGFILLAILSILFKIFFEVIIQNK